jgi:hypothetical protein
MLARFEMSSQMSFSFKSMTGLGSFAGWMGARESVRATSMLLCLVSLECENVRESLLTLLADQ